MNDDPAILHSSLEFSTDTWDDPGDYPSGAGAGPLPSETVAYCDGELVLSKEALDEFLNDLVPDGYSVTSWCHEVVDGNHVYYPKEVAWNR